MAAGPDTLAERPGILSSRIRLVAPTLALRRNTTAPSSLIACKPKVELELLPIPCDPVSVEDVLANVRDARNHEPKVLIVGTADYKIACRIGQNQKLCNVRRGQREVATWEIAEVFGTTTSSEREVLEAVRRLRRTIRLRSYGDADPLLIRDVSKCLGYDAAKHVERLWKKGYLPHHRKEIRFGP